MYVKGNKQYRQTGLGDEYEVLSVEAVTASPEVLEMWKKGEEKKEKKYINEYLAEMRKPEMREEYGEVTDDDALRHFLYKNGRTVFFTVPFIEDSKEGLG